MPQLRNKEIRRKKNVFLFIRNASALLTLQKHKQETLAGPSSWKNDPQKRSGKSDRRAGANANVALDA